MEEKTLIDHELVERMRKDNTIVLYIAFGLLGFGAIVALIAMPGIQGILVALVLIGILVFLIRTRMKRGPLQAYFVLRPVTDKVVRSSTEEGYATFYYHLIFDNKESPVNEDVYNETQPGRMFYVMYNAYDHSILGCFEEDKFYLDPSLDIRQPGQNMPAARGVQRPVQGMPAVGGMQRPAQNNPAANGMQQPVQRMSAANGVQQPMAPRANNFCSKCGNRLTPNDKFCAVCGTKTV